MGWNCEDTGLRELQLWRETMMVAKHLSVGDGALATVGLGGGESGRWPVAAEGWTKCCRYKVLQTRLGKWLTYRVDAGDLGLHQENDGSSTSYKGTSSGSQVEFSRSPYRANSCPSRFSAPSGHLRHPPPIGGLVDVASVPLYPTSMYEYEGKKRNGRRCH
jgi:hypothetical protein